METSNLKLGGIGCVNVLTIVFIVLKLTSLIHWSWLWVLSPIWIPVVLAVIILAIYSALEGLS